MQGTTPRSPFHRWLPVQLRTWPLALFAASLFASASTSADALDPLADEAVERLSSYIQVDTINPPGNETRAVKWFAEIFDAEGIEYETTEPAPGRGSIWARIKGGRKPGLLLLNHSDVVPANGPLWDYPPLSGKIANGYIYGRGALDMKGTGILQLQAFLAVHRSGKRPNRDIIFMATADEEAGGNFGAGYIVKHHKKAYAGVGYVLNEGGGGTLLAERPVFTIGAQEKVPLWLKLTFKGNPGHGSSPQVETAATRMVRSLNRLREHQFPPRVTDAVKAVFEGSASLQNTAAMRAGYGSITESIHDNVFMSQLQLANPGARALLSNTCSITRFSGSSKINVVPARVTAELDCRLLPDQDHDQFLAELRTVLNEPNVEFETLLQFAPAASELDTDLFALLKSTVEREYPGALVIPGVTGGFTDSHWFRELGINAYGFSPTLTPPADRRGVHGNNERVTVENIRRGTKILTRLVGEFVGVEP